MPRMNMGMQRFNIGRMLSNTGWNTEMFDVHAEMDSTLNYRENKTNIQQKLGIQNRNHGMEQMKQERQEHKREKIQRHQTGPIQGTGNLAIDQRLHAMRPGRRVSASGHVYYEYRANRSDVNPQRGL